MRCPQCGSSNNPRARRCGECGAPLRIDLPPRAASRTPRESRRIITVLFADIVGYTSLVEAHADQTEGVRALLQRCFDEMASRVLDHGGIVEKFIGDAVCALFGAPAVHEDDPERALACALAMQDAIARFNDTHSKAGSNPADPLRLRIGVSTGEVVGGTAEHGGQEQYSVTGDAVNTASRLQTAAEPGQVLVSAATERLTRDEYILESAGDIKLKGKRSLVQSFVLKGPRLAGLRSGLDFVNRRRELEHLQYCLDLASERDPQLLEIVGDAGVGKSRLVSAFADRVTSSAVVCRGSCPPMAAGPLHPFRAVAQELVRGLGPDRSQKPELSPALGVLEHIAAEGFASGADLSMEAIASAVQAVIQVIGNSAATVIVLENIHRGDPESLELLQRLIGRVRDERVLLTWTRRTGEEMVIQSDHTASFTRLSLRPLPERDAEQLMRQLLGEAPVPVTVQRLIVDRSGGNPLYIEAMVRTILEDGDLLDGRDSESLEIPTTVQGLIQARLDSLPEAQRLAVQEAAVVGREFDARLLQSVDLFGLDIAPALEALARRGMIEQVSGDTFAFRHVLTQEVCYDTMLQGLRAELHREVADAIPEMFPDRMVELAPVRADHYAKAGDTDRAVEVLVEAGG
jgi:adenylate cyclase